MIVRALDANGDWTFGAGKNNYLQGAAAVGQAIATRCLSFLGDCFFATDAGIDWFNLLGGKNQLNLQLALSSTILNTPNVISLTALSINLDDTTRAFSASYSVMTSFGSIQGVVNQNLGIGPLAPPAAIALLPQVDLTLLNNVSATAVTGAVFNPVAWWEVDLQYFIERRTATQSFVQRGLLVVKFDIHTNAWALTDFIFSGSSGPITGVTFTVDPTTGQVSYASDNMTGGTYVGNLNIQSTITIPAGA